MQIVGRTWLNLVAWTCGSWSEGQHDLYFTVQWFCLISWRLFDVFTSDIGSMNQYDPMFDLKINVGHCDLYSMVQWFYLISWRLFDVWTILFGIMSQYDPKFDLKINIGHYDVYFMIQWFCLISWRLFDVCTSYFGNMNQYDQTFGLKINVGHCDLYSMVQWFCLISWRLFDAWWMDGWVRVLRPFNSISVILRWWKGEHERLCAVKCRLGSGRISPPAGFEPATPWSEVGSANRSATQTLLFDAWTLLFGIMSRYDPKFYLKINIGHCDLYFMAQWFCVISWGLWCMNIILWD